MLSNIISYTCDLHDAYLIEDVELIGMALMKFEFNVLASAVNVDSL